MKIDVDEILNLFNLLGIWPTEILSKRELELIGFSLVPKHLDPRGQFLFLRKEDEEKEDDDDDENSLESVGHA